jgi:hypothetical protein
VNATKEPDWQQLMDGLTAALETLKQCDPHLNADDLERSNLARYFIRRVILGMTRDMSRRLREKGYQSIPDAALRAMLGGSVWKCLTCRGTTMLDPLIVPPGSGKSAVQRDLLRVLLAICQLGDGYQPDDHFADLGKMVLARRRRDHLRRLRVMETRRDA